MLPGILPQMGQENIGNLRRMAQESGYGAPGGGMGAIGGGGMGGFAGAGAGAGMGAHVVDDDNDDDGARSLGWYLRLGVFTECAAWAASRALAGAQA